MHFGVYNTYAERIATGGTQRAFFNPSAKNSNNLIYQYEPGDWTLVINDFDTDQKSIYMSGAVVTGAPPEGDFMP